MNWKFCFTFVLLLFASFSAHAALIWDMHFLPLQDVIRPIDAVIIRARLHNSSSSTESLGVIGGFLGVPAGFDYEVGALAFIPATTVDEYDWHWGPDQSGDFVSQFEGVDLAPGESFDFVFMVFSPRDGTAHPGTYSLWGQLQLFRASQDRPMVGASTDVIFWSVPRAVPEPGPFVLIIVGVVLILWTTLITTANERRP